MSFDYLRDAITKENKARKLKELIFFKQNCDTEDGRRLIFQRYAKTYKKNYKDKMEAYIHKTSDAELQKQLLKCLQVEDEKDFDSELIVSIEWTKSRMWGSNPRALTNFGFEGSSIGGCGYDKTSTATAGALNSDKRILKLMYTIKNEFLAYNQKTTLSQNEINQKLFGYGAGYSILPAFDGGVGVSCHQSICEQIGLKMRSISDTKTSNVYIVSKGVSK
jgi:hypothetical protein